MDRITDLFYVVLEVLGRQIALFSDGTILPMVRGAEGETDAIAVPDDLGEMDEATARDLHTKLEEQFQAKRKDAATKEQVEELRQIRATQARLAERVTAIGAEQAEIAQGLSEIDAPSTLPEITAPAAETTPAGENGTGNTPVATTVPAAPAQAASTTAPVTAGIGVPNIGGTQSPAVQTAAATAARPRVSYVAAAGQTDIQANAPVDFEQIGLMIDQAKGLDGSAGPVMAHVASLPGFMTNPDFAALGLSRDDGITATDRKIADAVLDWKIRTGRAKPSQLAQAGRTAAICDPLDIIREIPNCAMQDDPLGDSLPQRPAGRLGFQFTQAISISAVSAGATAGWGDTLQSFVDPATVSTWKPCVDIACPTPQSIRADEVVACARFDVTTEMSNPERVQDVLAKLAALRVRLRTQNLLQKMDALSSRYTFDTAFAYGAFPGMVEASMSVIARAIYAERLDPGDYQCYLPPGLLETIATDLAGRAFNTDDPAGEQEALEDVRKEVENAIGMKTIRLWDVVADSGATTSPFAALNPPGSGAIALPSLGGDVANQIFQVRFIAPEAALFFSTGEEKTGLESSPELMRQNKVQFFSREWVGLAKHGCHPWFTVAMELDGNGARTGFNTPIVV